MSSVLNRCHIPIICLVLLALPLGAGRAQDAPMRVFRETGATAPTPEIEVVEDLSLDPFGGATIYSLGEGRARLRYPLPRAAVPRQGAFAKDPTECFLLRWVDRRLHEMVPEAGPLEVTSFMRRKVGKPGEPRQRGWFLEVHGPDARLVLARDWLDRVFAAQRHFLEAEFRLVKVGEGARSPGTTGILEILDPAEMKRQWSETGARKGAEILDKGTLRVLCGEQGAYEHVNELAYIKDYEITTMQDSFIADPVIDVVREGISLDISGVVRPDDGSVALSSSLTIASLSRPIKSIKTRLAVGGGTEVEIQLPEVSLSSWSSDDIALGPKDAGFVVRGLRLTEYREDKPALQHDVEFYCRIRLANVAAAVIEGARIIAVDPLQKIVLVRFDRLQGTSLPKEIRFHRKGREVGRGEVRDRQGNLLVIRPLAGEPRVGDQVR